MNSSVSYRAALIAALLVVAGVALAPSLVTDLPQFWKDYLPSNRIRLGLDLQGGTHLVLTVDVDKAVEGSLQSLGDQMRKEADGKVALTGVERRDQRLLVRAASDNRSAVQDFLSENFPNLTVAETSTEGGTTIFQLAFAQRAERELREFALEQSLETLRNRIDQFGVTEPIIQRQGGQDILIQLPGIQDPQRAKDLIGRTAMLEFKLLADVPNAEGYLAEGATPPEGTVVLGGMVSDFATGRKERTKYLVEAKTLMRGDVIADAKVRPPTNMEGPYVALTLNSTGSRQFDELTAANVGRRLAIVLDDTVYSAPVIRERISGGEASITGNFEIKEARDLAIVLRAGALPAPVSIAEERTVGPSLGKDSIDQGFLSFLVGGLFVIVFMVLYYRGAGVLADAALILNIVFLLGAIALLQATLTLPGIAGIVLTLGMAVDANVLINERIREELRLAKAPRAAIEAGYERALPAILDSNVTTFLAGLIMFQFGSGPIKGFAVTLCVGILTTVFTAVVCTRTVYDWRLAGRRIESISI